MSACGRADHRRQSLSLLEMGRPRSLSEVSRRPAREAQDSRSGQRRSVLQPRAAHCRTSVGCSTNLLTLTRSSSAPSRQCERDILDRELAMLGLKHMSQYLRNVIYLQDMGVEISGVKFFGSPWLDKRSCHGMFEPFLFIRVSANKNATFYSSRQEIMKKWNRIPRGIDVLITCQPPLGTSNCSTSTASERSLLSRLRRCRLHRGASRRC